MPKWVRAMRSSASPVIWISFLVGGDWTYDPFRLTREDDHVYGRGTTDDKGPILEALYAMKLLRDHGVKLNQKESA